MHKSYYSRSIYSSAITDTDAKTTDTAEISGYSKKSIIIKNGLNQSVSVQIQGSSDDITFVNVGTATVVTTGVNALVGVNEIAQLGNYFPYLRVTLTSSVAPTSGVVAVVAVASL